MRQIASVAALLLLTTLVARPAAAASLDFAFAVQFSNSTLPGGPAPWINVNLNDSTAAAGYDVRATITGTGLTGSEFITGVYLSNTTNPAQLTANEVSDSNGALEDVLFGADAFQADGDGKYDILFDFSSNPPRFTNGETYVVDFNWTGGSLTLASFNILAAPGGGHGPFFAAAHLQGISTGDGSTWIADGNGGSGDCPGCTPTPTGVVPEPASMFLLGSGLLGLAGYRRRARR